MTATVFQKFHVDHNPAADVPLNYEKLKQGGFEAVNFRPEDKAEGYKQGVETVAARIDDLRKQKTFRGTPFAGNVWYADPASTDSQAAGIPVDAEGWAAHIIGFVRKLTEKGCRPEVLKLNIEFTGKGFPPRQANTFYKAWSVVQVDGWQWQTRTDGTTSSGFKNFPKATVGATVPDGTLTWNVMLGKGLPVRSDPDAWGWNERVAELVFNGLPAQPIEVQPMSRQADFNLGAWMSRGARCSPQCYGSQPYLANTTLETEIQAVVGNPYVKGYYGFTPDRRRVHPTIGAFGQGKFYVPAIKEARAKGLFGIRVFPHNDLTESDYSDYRGLVVA
jgi:hypothetical protein